MKKNNWMDVEMGKEDVMIIDCGYLHKTAARDRVSEILALGVGKSNLIWGPSAGEQRMHVNIPKNKQEEVLAALPVSGEKTWFGATHSYLGEDKNETVKAAA